MVDFKDLEGCRRLALIDVEGAASLASIGALRRIPVQALNINVQTKPDTAPPVTTGALSFFVTLIWGVESG